MPDAPRPGWYPDPAGSRELRWWDGDAWTETVSESADPPRSRGVGDLSKNAPDPADPAAQGISRHKHHDGRRRRSTLRTLMVLTCGFAVFSAAGLGAGLLLWRDAPSEASRAMTPASTVGVASGVTSGSPPPIGRLDASSRLASIGPASMTLPGAPYELYDDPMEIDGVFDTLFLASADVHPSYDGKHTWSATVALAHISPELTGSDDLGPAGATAVVALSKHLFGGHRTTVTHLVSSDRSVDGHPGMMFTVDVHYAIASLPSRYDSVNALVVRLDDGSLVAAVSSVPHDADGTLRRLALKTIDSLSVR